MFILGKAVSFIFLPPGSIVLLFVLGFIFSLFRKSDRARAWSKAFVVFGALAFIVCSLGPLADLALLPLENGHSALGPAGTLEAKDVEGCTAVIVLGSGTTAFSPDEGGGSSLGPRAARRVSYAYRLARRLGLPLVFSGGKVFESAGQEGEAQAAQRFLTESGMDGRRIMIEDKSVSTWENAVLSAATLKAAGLAPKAILVTSAFHMPRAVMSFRKNGIEVVPAPTDYLADRSPKDWTSWIPSAEGCGKISMALHEYLGWLWYSLKPKAKA
jgi:uncharacterized SAM-binding protein YcdF (DUF218 family)